MLHYITYNTYILCSWQPVLIVELVTIVSNNDL